MLLCFLCSTAFSQTYSYPYFRFADVESSSKVSNLYFEYRATPTDTIAALWEDKTSFLPNCLRQKTIYYYKDNQTGRLAEDARDSLVYENGQLKTYYYSRKNSFAYVFFSKWTLFKSRDLKNDTIVITRQYGTGAEQISRSILLRNQKNQDSLYFEQMFDGVSWVSNNMQYVMLKYNSAAQLTEIKNGYLNNGVFFRGQTTSYTYEGLNIASRIDSGFTYTIGIPAVLNFLSKRAYKYNAQQQKTEDISSEINSFSTSSVDTFRLTRRNRYTLYNAKNLLTESFSDTWDGQKWTEVGRSVNTYKQDTLLILGLGYDRFNNAWRLNSRIIYDYCSLPNSTVNIEALPLTVSPNPANDIVNITSDAAFDADSKLMLFNNAGQLILERSHVTLPYSLDISNLSQGLYFTKISASNGQSGIKKFVVVK